jgi:hypothetical protein
VGFAGASSTSAGETWSMANFVLPEVSFQLMQLFVCYRRVPPSRLRATTAGVLGTVWKVGWAPANAGTLKEKGERGGAPGGHATRRI